MVTVLVGDLFASSAQTWTNTINCVGVMGRGVAKGFRERFPDLFADYVARCERGEVRLGQPYLFKRSGTPWVLNFPTKHHWRGVSRLEDIERGLDVLEKNAVSWGITSLAVPPLGCGNGQLDWRIVGPVLYQRLCRMPFPVELYAPHDTPAEQLSLAFLAREGDVFQRATGQAVSAGVLALVELLARVERERYRAPVGRVAFQKMAYFATVQGVPTGLTFVKGSYGPFAPGLKRLVAQLGNNGLIEEVAAGPKIEVRVGKAYAGLRPTVASQIRPFDGSLETVADLFLRFQGRQPEIAASVHYAAHHLVSDPETATEADVLAAVQTWKARRQPPLPENELRSAIRHLNLLGWIDVAYTDQLLPVDDGVF